MNRVRWILVVSGFLTFISFAAPLTGAAPTYVGIAAQYETVETYATPLLIAGILPKDGEAMYELEFWNSIKDSKHAEDYEAYLKAYPNGKFAPLAKTRAERYRKKPVDKPKEPSPTRQISIRVVNDNYQVTKNVNIRKEPSSKAPKIGQLKRGKIVLVTGIVSGKNWYRIETPSGGSGYVFAPLMKRAPAREVVKANKLPQTPAPAPITAPSRTLQEFQDCSHCPQMVVIPPGTFSMGDNRGDLSERPKHTVRIKRPFALGKYEVTVAQWAECVNAGVCKSVSENFMQSPNAPIRDVSWGDAQDYTSWLTEVTNQQYRLPTEAEWEYAARAGTKSTYWWGDRMTSGKANCKDCGNNWNSELPMNVGSLDPNPYGLHDMNGNVWEWVSDCWHKNYSGSPTDGRSWDRSNCSTRVIRSGSWRNDKSYVHSASRFKYDAYVRYLQNGFRVAKSLQ